MSWIDINKDKMINLDHVIYIKKTSPTIKDFWVELFTSRDPRGHYSENIAHFDSEEDRDIYYDRIMKYLDVKVAW